MNPVVYSSKTAEWSTPPTLFRALDQEFGFTLDPCATPENAKCLSFYTKEDDGLSRIWPGVVFMNPPYGYRIQHWVRKAYEESKQGSVVVCLIPAKTETRWWHDYVMKAEEIRFIKGRIQFGGGHADNPESHNAPFPSAVVVFRCGDHTPRFTTMDRNP